MLCNYLQNVAAITYIFVLQLSTFLFYNKQTIKEIYGKFENLQMFPGMGSDLSKRVSFRTDYKYAIWEDYVIIYKIGNEYVEIYRVVNRYQDITRICD